MASRLQTAADLARPVPVCPPETTVIEAARIMTRAGSSAILICGPDGYGIATDEDFRRQVAVGAAGETPVSEVMSPTAEAVSPDRLVEDVVIEMLRTNHHHLLVSNGERLFGVISHHDVLAAEALHPFRILGEIAAAPIREELVVIAGKVPVAVAAIIRAGLNATRASEVMSLMVDAITRRLLDLAEDELGPSPCRWAWIALGSQGRREQAIATDQDHALIYEAAGEDGYFDRLATHVVEGLEACGIPRCPSGVMASEPGWRLSPAIWAERTRQWITDPDLGRAFFTEIIFDFRQVAGPYPGEALLTESLVAARQHRPFMLRLTRLAVAHRIPLRRFGARLVAPGGVMDVKTAALRPLTELARVLGIEAGSNSPSTQARLRKAAAASVLDGATSHDLCEAFETMMRIRLSHQLRRWEEDLPVDEQIRITELGRIGRAELAQALAAVARAQDEQKTRLVVASRLSTAVPG
jgi:CBS domain-containing protein